MNLRTHFALIVISSPARGVLPFQAFHVSTLNGPNPTSTILPLLFNVSVMDEKTQSTTA